MDLAQGALLVAAGFGGGIAAAIAGGASLVTFPTLLALGLPPVAANATNAVGLSLSNFMAAVADWRRRPSWGRSLSWLFVINVVGGALGALLMLETPADLLILLVPGADRQATLLFAVGPWVQRHLPSQRRWRAAHGAGGVPDLPVLDLWRLFRRGARRHQPRHPGDRRPDRPAQHQRLEEHPHHRGQRVVGVGLCLAGRGGVAGDGGADGRVDRRRLCRRTSHPRAAAARRAHRHHRLRHRRRPRSMRTSTGSSGPCPAPARVPSPAS